MKQSLYASGVLVTSQRRPLMVVTLLISLLALSQPSVAQLRDAVRVDIGLTQLRAENPGLTEGVGVKGQLVEAFVGGPDRYVPDPDDPLLSGSSINMVNCPATAELRSMSSRRTLI